MMTDYRKKISPSNLQSQTFLMINKAFWTHFDVQEILKKSLRQFGFEHDNFNY